MSDDGLVPLDGISDKISPLCDVCGQIGTSDARWFVKREKRSQPGLGIYIHQPDLHSLDSSARDGCRLCWFLLLSILNSDDARHEPTTDAATDENIVANILLNSGTGITVADKKLLLQKHSHELSPAIAFVLQKNLRDAGNNQGLDLLPKLCGNGSIVLIGTTYANRLPFNLRAVVLRPLGALRFYNIPLIAGLPFELAAGLEDPLEPLATAWTVSPTLFTDSLLHRIRGWRKICFSRHSKCREMRGPQPLPSRVIEVSAKGSPQTVKIRDSRGQFGTYAALSYCWGICPQIRTTKSTLAEHFRGVRVSMLPETIQDAIKLCRSLEIPYLWVDSLCIVQDDLEDWHHEATQMAAIYGRATLTITTPQNSQCDEGFSTLGNDRTRESSLPQLLWERNKGEETVTGLVTARPKAVDSGGCSPFPYSHGRTHSPWMTRGWTLQEWLLSPRVLHCGSERVWDCYQTWYTETHLTISSPSGALNGTDSVRDGLASHIFARMGRLDPTIREASLDTHWSRLVEHFTSRTLSRAMDKLPAIAGLATKFMEHSHAKAPGAIYLAGLWYYKGINPFGGHTYPTSQLPLGLLWRRAGVESMQSPGMYRAPSWSWSALDGPVGLFRLDWPLAYVFKKTDDFRLIPMLEVKSATCLFDPPGSYSLAQSAWIIARGPLKRAHINPSGKVAPLQSASHSEYSRTFVRLDTHQGREESSWFGIFDEFSEQTGVDYVNESLYLLHVAAVVRTSDDGKVTDFIHHALILEKLGSFNNSDCYRRLGVGWYSSSEAKEAAHLESAYGWSDRKMLKYWEYCQVRLI